MSPEVKLTHVYIKEKGKFKTGRKIYISNNLLLSWNNNMQLIQPLLYHTQWWAKQNGGLGEEGGEGVQKTKKTQTLGGKAESLKILNKEFSWKSAWKRTWKRTWTASASNQPTSCNVAHGLDTGITWSGPKKPSSSHSLTSIKQLMQSYRSHKLMRLPKSLQTCTLPFLVVLLIPAPHLTPPASLPQTDTAQR